jgi:hypothetical protein
LDSNGVAGHGGNGTGSYQAIQVAPLASTTATSGELKARATCPHCGMEFLCDAKRLEPRPYDPGRRVELTTPAHNCDGWLNMKRVFRMQEV